MTSSCTSEVALYLKGDDLDPDHVTTILGIAPSRAQRKGEARVTSTNHAYSTKTGLWVLSRKQETAEIGPVMEALAREVTQSQTPVHSIPGVTEAYMDLFIATDADAEGEGTCSFALTPSQLRETLRLDVPCRFTVTVVKP